MDFFNQLHNFVGQDNDFFRGGLLLGVLGFLGAWLRGVPALVLNYLRSRLIHTLRIDSEESTLFSALGKLLESPEVQVQTRTFRLLFDESYRQSGKTALQGITRHYNADYFVFRYKGYTYYVDFEETKPGQGRYQSHFIYRISAFWRSKAAIECLLEALAANVSDKSPDQLAVHYRSEGYFQQSLISKRALESLYFEPELLEDLLGDMQSFSDSREWYKRLSIPYRRGYLLYGEPGTGKTSLIKGVASHFDKAVYVIGEAALELSSLRGIFQDIPPGSVVVIEDFDRLFMKPENKVSMSALLNQLDGLETQEGLMIFITANHREVFDAALERPGRIDRKFYIGYMGWPAAKQMFCNFFGPQFLDQFEQVWLDGLYTPAQLQVYFSKYKHDSQTAVANFGRILEEIGETSVNAVA